MPGKNFQYILAKLWPKWKRVSQRGFKPTTSQSWALCLTTRPRLKIGFSTNQIEDWIYLEHDGVHVNPWKGLGLFWEDLPHQDPEGEDVTGRRREGVLQKFRRDESGSSFDEGNLFIRWNTFQMKFFQIEGAAKIGQLANTLRRNLKNKKGIFVIRTFIQRIRNLTTLYNNNSWKDWMNKKYGHYMDK